MLFPLLLQQVLYLRSIKNGVQKPCCGLRNFPIGGTSILDAALQRGADLPYACKGGVCCTCKARLLEGKVKMDLNYGLEPDEVAAGYILTCQSHPVTETVKVDFDNR